MDSSSERGNAPFPMSSAAALTVSAWASMYERGMSVEAIADEYEQAESVVMFALIGHGAGRGDSITEIETIGYQAAAEALRARYGEES